MAFSLSAEQKNISVVFSGETQYVIPPYQRPYSWKEEHCMSLFDDLKNAYEDKEEGYFLGNIVIAKSNENSNSLEVIDGQQRLTTLIIFMKVLLHFDKSNLKLKHAINIPSAREGGEEKRRLLTNVFIEKDAIFMEEVLKLDLSGQIESFSNDNQFKKNLCYFYKRVDDFCQEDIQGFVDFLLIKYPYFQYKRRTIHLKNLEKKH